jgi:carboxypeptidase C (cathepsin A)
VGESYGTTRAAGLSGHLADKGIALNGVILISSILDFETARIGRTNELPYSLFLPSFTATAWYHKKLPEDLQRLGLTKAIEEAGRWAEGDYRAILDKGDQLSPDERAEAVKRLARYTGLSERFLDLNNLRVSESQFGRELLRNERRSVGRYDSRYVAIIENAGTPFTEFDPSYAAVLPAYTSMFNQYVRTELGYRTDTTYHVLGSPNFGTWDWGLPGGGFPETSAALRQAMAKNPHMKVLIAAGYYDLATPFSAVGYTIAHMRLGGKPLLSNISITTYEAGHMMYLHKPSLEKLKRDAAMFVDGTH